MNVWKAAVKNYSYVLPICHSELLLCLNGKIRWISSLQRHRMKAISCVLKEVVADLPMAEMVIGTSLLG